ncbi:hypothetical protein MchiMG62_15870 [Methanoculleus chikugoensis]|uniref:Uncharacterized protein n=2 Tax=Methanoculleus chikugoensis TaxID=118126 RepID=A0ABN5XMX6_9EURY|nr:hypothetical protein MchiMG62_15870 [Methanoculleus chikugoensis]
MHDGVIQKTVSFRNHEHEMLAGMSDATDRQIGLRAYESYGLAEDEVAIAEGAKG